MHLLVYPANKSSKGTPYMSSGIILQQLTKITEIIIQFQDKEVPLTSIWSPGLSKSDSALISFPGTLL